MATWAFSSGVHELLFEVAVLVEGCRLWGTQAQSLWLTGFLTPWRMVSSQIRDWTSVPLSCTGRQVINQLSCECMFLGSLSRHNKDLEWRTLKPPRRVTALRSWIDRVIALRSRKDRVIALRQISVTALFYLEDSRKIHLQDMRARWSKDTRRRRPSARERERAGFGSSIYMFLSPWACPM